MANCKKLVCPICGDTFSSNAEFYAHISEHESDEIDREAITEEMQDIAHALEDFISLVNDFNNDYNDSGYGVEIEVNEDNVATLELHFYTPNGEETCDCHSCATCEGEDCEGCDEDSSSSIENTYENLTKNSEYATLLEEIDRLFSKAAEGEKVKDIESIDISDAFDKLVANDSLSTFVDFIFKPDELINRLIDRIKDYASSKGVDITNDSEYERFLERVNTEIAKDPRFIKVMSS